MTYEPMEEDMSSTAMQLANELVTMIEEFGNEKFAKLGEDGMDIGVNVMGAVTATLVTTTLERIMAAGSPEVAADWLGHTISAMNTFFSKSDIPVVIEGQVKAVMPSEDLPGPKIVNN